MRARDLILPKSWHEWVYVGSPLTPFALNGGKACPEGPDASSSGPCTGFPEYHSVYIEPGSYEIYKRRNEFPEGTIMFKEPQLTLPKQNADGSRTEPSGRGLFPGPFNGADVTVLLCSHLGGLSFWLMMIEIVVAPPMGVGITLGVLARLSESVISLAQSVLTDAVSYCGRCFHQRCFLSTSRLRRTS